jgi:hypothetical protein
MRAVLRSVFLVVLFFWDALFVTVEQIIVIAPSQTSEFRARRTQVKSRSRLSLMPSLSLE